MQHTDYHHEAQVNHGPKRRTSVQSILLIILTVLFHNQSAVGRFWMGLRDREAKENKSKEEKNEKEIGASRSR